MKTISGSLGLCLLGLMLAWLVGGCAGTSSSDKESEAVAQTTSTSPTEPGCCGGCSGKDPAATNAAECCGKCQAEMTSANPTCCSETSETSAISDSPQERQGKGRGKGGGKGQGKGKGMGKGPGGGNDMRADRDVFHYLLENHQKIRREVTVVENGVKTVTESDDPAVAAKIQEHVFAMKKRVEEKRPIRMWDQLFQAIFRHAGKIEMKVEKTDTGVKVTETSTDPLVAKLIQLHAEVVSGFVKRGFEEAHEDHPVPQNLKAAR